MNSNFCTFVRATHTMFVEKKLVPLLLSLTLICCASGQSITESVNAFTIDLLRTISREPTSPNNLALSPYTVWTLLSIIDEGARGETAQQLERVLRIPGRNNKDNFRRNFQDFSRILSNKYQGVDLDIYNSIFTNMKQKLIRNYSDTVQTHYNAKIQPINFSNKRGASDKINKYVAQATKNRITDFIRPEDLDYAEIFLVSALYFKGEWTTPFNRSQTRPDTFYDEKQNKLGEVNMMYQMNPFAFTRFDAFQGSAVELPYGTGDKMSMILMLPYKDQSIQGMLEAMTRLPFTDVINKLEKSKIDYEDEDVQVYLPRFKVDSDLTLNLVLQKMGISDVFDDTRADLLGMFPHYLYVSRLIQRAEIEVNEEGTVASAAAGATVVNKIPPPKFVANKPFLYFIVNKPTKSIMFSGKVTVPPLLNNNKKNS